MLLEIFKAVFRVFCGPGKQEQAPQPQPGHTKPPPVPNTHTTPQKPPRLQDPNQVNQSNEYYLQLRADANRHGDQMAKCFEQSHEAYAQGNGALAKELSNQGKEHKEKMEKLNKQASEWIFRENNTVDIDSQPDEVDLHGLYVKEAVAFAEQAIIKAKRDRESHIKFIVGKGLHSQGGVAKIKPAIEGLIQKHQLIPTVDPRNPGVLVVQLSGGNHERGMGADEISRRLDTGDGCIIM